MSISPQIYFSSLNQTTFYEASIANQGEIHSSLVQFSEDGESYSITYEGQGGKQITEFHMREKPLMEVAGEVLYSFGKKFSSSWSSLNKRVPNPSFLHIGPVGAKGETTNEVLFKTTEKRESTEPDLIASLFFGILGCIVGIVSCSLAYQILNEPERARMPAYSAKNRIEACDETEYL